MNFLAFALASCALSVVAGAAENHAPLKVGDALPDVAGVDQDGKKLSPAEYGKTGFLLVYFYPKSDTPGCTKQACSLRDNFSELKKRGVKIIGVSVDKPEAQKKFIEKYTLPFPLIADTGGAVLKAFGVPTGLSGAAKRQAFLFENGKCVWLDYTASTENQAADVLAFLAKK